MLYSRHQNCQNLKPRIAKPLSIFILHWILDVPNIYLVEGF